MSLGRARPADRGTQAAIYAAHQRALAYVLCYVEQCVFTSRSGKNGVVQEEICGVFGAAFDAISALRDGDARSAQGMLTGAMDQLDAYAGALEPGDRAVLDEEVGELRRLSALTSQGNTERSVKSSYASMSSRSRSRRPRRTDDTR